MEGALGAKAGGRAWGKILWSGFSGAVRILIANRSCDDILNRVRPRAGPASRRATCGAHNSPKITPFIPSLLSSALQAGRRATGTGRSDLERLVGSPGKQGARGRTASPFRRRASIGRNRPPQAEQGVRLGRLANLRGIIIGAPARSPAGRPGWGPRGTVHFAPQTSQKSGQSPAQTWHGFRPGAARGFPGLPRGRPLVASRRAMLHFGLPERTPAADAWRFRLRFGGAKPTRRFASAA
jgi:hypothetical protein